MNRNTMSYGNDNFQFRRQSLLKTSAPFDLTNETSCRGFSISGTQPSGSNRRIIFEVDGKLYYFTNDGLTRYKWYGELADILEHGNTVEELLAVTGVVQWVGKKVYPIIALDAPRDAEIMPKIKLRLKVNCFNDEFSRDELSPVYELSHTDNPARIISATYEKSTNGQATAKATLRLRNIDGVWGDWIDFDDAAFKEACAVQFKAHYVLTTLDGSDDAKIFNCNVFYITDSKNPSGNVSELFTAPQSYYADFGTCYAIIKHSELVDADIKAYIKFQSPTSGRKDLTIGTGDGTLQTYYLGTNGGIDPAINQDSICLSAGGVNVLDFYYNVENATVSLTAPSGTTVKATYEYNIDAENWVEMSKQTTEVYDDTGQYLTRFTYHLDHNLNPNKKISAIKFSITRKTGKVENEILGTGTGRIQTFILPHRAMFDTINADGSWFYDEDTQLFFTTAPFNSQVKISYDWVGIIPEIFSFVAGWTPDLSIVRTTYVKG